MKINTFLLFSILTANISIAGAQTAPQEIPAGKPIVVSVPEKKYRVTVQNEAKKNISEVASDTRSPIGELGGNMSITNYNTEQGLAMSSIACIYIDRIGNLWVGTNGNGISRYDGKSFTNFSTKQGLKNSNVRAIMEDKKGNMWFGTYGGGISRYDGRSFMTFTTADGLASNAVWSGITDRSGNLWFGTKGGGVICYNGKKFINYTTRQGLANNSVVSIFQDRSGDLWFGTDSNGVSRYDGRIFNNFDTKKGLPNNYVTSIVQDKAGDLWFGTYGGGLSRFNGRSFVTYTTAQGLGNNIVDYITVDSEGNLWVGTYGGGISRYDGKTFINFTKAEGLPSNNVCSIVEDKSGNLWLGTWDQGISRYLGKSCTDFTSAQGLVNSNVWKITQDRAGNLWFGTHGGGAFRYNGKSFIQFTMSQGLPNNNVRSIIQDKAGHLWFGTYGGVSCYDGKTFTTFTKKQGLVDNSVRTVFEDKEGNLWVGTNDSGVSCYNGKSFINFGMQQGLASNQVWCIKQDKTGKLWFGTFGGGVSCYDGKIFTTFTTEQGLANNIVECITEDTDGNLWLGTHGGGVSRYDGKTFINFTTAQGLADDVVYDIVADEQGDIVIGTNLGFSILKRFKSLEESNSQSTNIFITATNRKLNSELKNYQPVFEYYNEKTGFPIKDLNGNSMLCDNRGIIWGGCGDNRVIRFDYNAIRKSTEPEMLFIQDIKIQGEDISWYDLIINRNKDARRESNELNKTGTTSSSQFLKAPSDSLARLNEEILLFGRPLSARERNAMQRKFSGIGFDSITRFYPVPENLVLPYKHNNITFDFAAIEPAKPNLVLYQWMLEGYDKDWNPPTGKTTANFGNIHEGYYTLKLRAKSPDGVWSQPLIYKFNVLPPWFRTWWAYALYSLLFLFMLWSFIRWRIRALKNEKVLLEKKVTKRTVELQKEKEKVVSTLNELKAAQAQLIQSEKMASLGELTAGIAHEIQNPLNFVNNFSEVNRELIDEMQQELDNGNLVDAKAISNDIKENEEKINHHGKKADAIVKGMLQHSRSSTGIKEPTNINALADEYFRLGYHGLRAKDKDFNATMNTDFDNSIGKVNIIPQDIGRVLLNLYNNSFYAVTEKAKQKTDGYEPTISVSTKKINNKVELTVKDNGNGIPKNIADKIFQPFFTTKPTGEGTGLGLSLSYDIIKAHAGELKMESKEGAGTEFTIILPIS